MLMAFAASFLGAMGVAMWQGRAAVSVEVGSALAAQHAVAKALLEREDGATPDALAAVFNGDRHVRAVVIDAQGRSVAASTPAAPVAPAPAWFNRLLRAPLQPLTARDRAGVTIRLDPYAANEVEEVWSRTTNEVLVLALSWLVCGLVMQLALQRALKPIDSLMGALARLQAGDYSARASAAGVSELMRLGRGLDALAARLEDAEARARALGVQLARAQQEERAEIARNLHDELGPELFGVRLDAAALARQRSGATDEEKRRIASILTSTARMQRLTRDLLARLRPPHPARAGLAIAVEAMLEGWRQRLPELAFTLGTRGAEPPEDDLRESLFHVAQEGVYNALRHGRPGRIEVRLERVGGSYVVTVEDDGAAPPGRREGGTGLLGLRERIAACGGALDVEEWPDGWRLRARAPSRDPGPARIAAE